MMFRMYGITGKTKKITKADTSYTGTLLVMVPVIDIR